jgi:hypothetical protein
MRRVSHRPDRRIPLLVALCSGCQIGEVSAWPVPTVKISASSSQGETSPAEAGDHQGAAIVPSRPPGSVT